MIKRIQTTTSQRLRPFALLVVLVGGAFLLSTCKSNTTDTPTVDCLTPAECQYKKYISEADEMLSHFEGDRAAHLYEAALALAQAEPVTTNTNTEVTATVKLDECHPAYGAMLGWSQQLFRVLNNVVGGVVNIIFNNNATSETSPAFTALATSDPAFAFDFGNIILNAYTTGGRQALDAIATYGNLIKQFPQCTFTLSGGVPFRLIHNDDPIAVVNDENGFVIELSVGENWDQAEAVFLQWVAELFRNLFFFLLAHDLYLDEDQFTQFQIFGDSLRQRLECGIAGHRYYGKTVADLVAEEFGDRLDASFEDTLEGADPNGTIDTAAECLYLVNLGDVPLVQRLRRFGFLIGDHPRTLAKHTQASTGFPDGRWAYYMPKMAPQLAVASKNIATIFDLLNTRAQFYNPLPLGSEQLKNFALSYSDASDDGIFNTGDIVGLGVVGVRLALPNRFNFNISEDTLSKAIEFVFSTINFRFNSDASLTALKSIFNNIGTQLEAVNNANLDADILPLSALQPLANSLPNLFDDNPIPEVMAIDFKAYFTNPKPLRQLLPYWEAVLTNFGSTNVVWVNEFIIEAELPQGVPAFYSWQTTPATDAVNGDVGHFSSENYLALDPAQDFSEPTLAVPGTTIPADCYTPESQSNTPLQQLLGLKPESGLIYVYWQDPTFSGLIQTRTAALITCPGLSNSNTYTLANQESLNRAIIAQTRWLSENFVLLDLINNLFNNTADNP